MSDSGPRVTLVTGGTGVVGVGIVRRLHAEGHKIVATYHTNDEGAAAIVAELDPDGHRLFLVKADLSDAVVASDVIKTATGRFGRVDGIVHSAAIIDTTLIDDLTADEFETVFSVNVTAPFLLIRGAARRSSLRSAVLLTSIAAEYTGMGSAPYEASKAAVSMLTRTLAAHYAPHIRINAIAPGIVESPRTVNHPKFSASALEGRIPLGGLARPENIAALTSFLLSPEAGFITGQILTVDGGFTLRLT